MRSQLCAWETQITDALTGRQDPRDLSTLSIDWAVVFHEPLQDSAVSGGLAVARYPIEPEATNSIRTAGYLAEGDHVHETCLLGLGNYWKKNIHA
jgi:hypothetical protein